MKYKEFEKEVMAAADTFAAHGMTCPECGNDALEGGGCPDEYYLEAELLRTERFICPMCGFGMTVTDTYVLDPSHRKIEYKL